MSLDAKQLLALQVDIDSPIHGVEAVSNADGTTLWVNVDGVCLLRISNIPVLAMRRPIMELRDADGPN